MLKRLLKKILPSVLWGYLQLLIAFHRRQSGFVKDYFHSCRHKKVLLSYVTLPFKTKNLYSHTNIQEALAIAEAFHDLGYSVDIIDYDSSKALDYSQYSCIFGFGDPFCASFYNDIDVVRIHYATGAHVHVQNIETLKRAAVVHSSKGKLLLNSCRIVKQTWSEQTTISDAIVVLGNNWTKNTYAQNFCGPIYTLGASNNAALPLSFQNLKDFYAAKTHYLWFGSAGAIHKGLDLLLEVFAAHPEITLHIAGLSDSEKDFMECFRREFAMENIITHGFVDVKSQYYASIISKCAFVIMPSCSEGACTSVINCMSNGLIPVITRQCGLDIKEYAVEITALTKEAISDAVRKCDAFGVEELRGMSDACCEDTRLTSSCDVFKQNMAKILQQIVN